MKKVLRQIWADISQGNNLDLYVLVAISVVLVTLNLIGRAPQSLEPFTIAILAILAMAILGNRYRLDKIMSQVFEHERRNHLFLTDLSDLQNKDLERRMEKASDLMIIGTTLGGTLELHYDLLESKLKQGHKVRILLVDPNGNAAKMAALRKYHHLDPNDWSQQVLSTLKALTVLSSKFQGTSLLEIKTLDFHIAHGGILVDTDFPKANGILFLWYYSFKTRKGTRPKFILESKDGHWYSHFIEEAGALWEAAKIWDYPQIK